MKFPRDNTPEMDVRAAMDMAAEISTKLRSSGLRDIDKTHILIACAAVNLGAGVGLPLQDDQAIWNTVYLATRKVVEEMSGVELYDRH